MKQNILLKAGIRRHKGSIFGCFILFLLLSLTLCTVISIHENSKNVVQNEMERLGFGDVTTWVSNAPNEEALLSQINALDEIEKATTQKIIFADYELNKIDSDSEGQFIVYDKAETPYRFFNNDQTGYINAPQTVKAGEVFLPVALISTMNAQIGQELTVKIARNGGTEVFTVAGFFEDPFFGSSMIGMKSFLINKEDASRISLQAKQAEIDSLARTGLMIHIFSNKKLVTSSSEIDRVLNEKTYISQVLEFSHSKETIEGFMLVLQKAYVGFLLAFAAILLAVALVVLGHNIKEGIQRDTENIAILKTVGMTEKSLQIEQIFQYSIPLGLGLLLGMIGAVAVVPCVAQKTLSSTGVLIPSSIPLILCITSVLILLVLLVGFTFLCTNKITRISPMDAISKNQTSAKRANTPIKSIFMPFWLALRQVSTGWKQYTGAVIIAILLVFFAGLMGRLNSWLGPNGEGLMDAFNPADHDLGVQIFDETPQSEVEDFIKTFSEITDKYELAMPTVALNGVNYTANAITDSSRFHILKGKTCLLSNEVVLTEFLASDLGVTINDEVTLSSSKGSKTFTVTGIYQCANDMGANFGLTKDGWLSISNDNKKLWCVHYFLQDKNQRIPAMDALIQKYDSAIHVHENGWPGLYSILSAMKNILIIMSAISVIFTLITVFLTGSRILSKEKNDLAIYTVLGMSSKLLQVSFALRFLVISTIGAVLGTLLSNLITDLIVGTILRSEGIADFASNPSLQAVLFPGAAVIILFTLFAWLVSSRLRNNQAITIYNE